MTAAEGVHGPDPGVKAKRPLVASRERVARSFSVLRRKTFNPFMRFQLKPSPNTAESLGDNSLLAKAGRKTRLEDAAVEIWDALWKRNPKYAERRPR